MNDSPVSIGPSVSNDVTPDHFALACLMISYSMKRYKDLRVTAQAVHDTFSAHNKKSNITIKSLKKHMDRLTRLRLVYCGPNLSKSLQYRSALTKTIDIHRDYYITDKGIAVFQMQRNDATMFKCLKLFESSRTEYGPPRPVVWALHRT